MECLIVGGKMDDINGCAGGNRGDGGGVNDDDGGGGGGGDTDAGCGRDLWHSVFCK